MSRWLFAVILLSYSQGFGAETVIEMLNQQGSEMMVFSKKFIHIEPGDSVLWKATDKTHSVAFVKDGIPKGVPLFRSPFNEDARFVFNVPGIYVYKCVGHYGMGMIGMVVVGNDTHNLEQVEQLVLLPAAKKQLRNLLIESKMIKPVPNLQKSSKSSQAP